MVLATDAHTGTVFRLKKHPASSHPPVWTALPGTGPGTSLHMTSCSLSMADYIVGVALNGHAYSFCNDKWICMGGGAMLNSIDVGTDGYVLGVDRDGDLFGCQLQSTVVTPRMVSSQGLQLTRNNKSYEAGPESPQAPNLPSMLTTPRVQTASKRPMASPRELFEMAGSEKGSSISPNRNRSPTSDKATEQAPVGFMAQPSHSNSYSSRYDLARSESQRSKSSYASDIGVATTLTGLAVSQASRDRPGIAPTALGNAFPKPTGNGYPSTRTTPLRIRTTMLGSDGTSTSGRSAGDSYFSYKHITPTGASDDISLLASLLPNGNPYPEMSRVSSQRKSDGSLRSPLDYLPLSANSSCGSRQSVEQWHNNRGDRCNEQSGGKEELGTEDQPGFFENAPQPLGQEVGSEPSHVDSSGLWDANDGGNVVASKEELFDSDNARIDYDIHRRMINSETQKITSPNYEEPSGSLTKPLNLLRGNGALPSDKTEWIEAGDTDVRMENATEYVNTTRVPVQGSTSYDVLHQDKLGGQGVGEWGGRDRLDMNQDKREYSAAYPHNNIDIHFPLPPFPDPRSSYTTVHSSDTAVQARQVLSPDRRHYQTAKIPAVGIGSISGDKEELESEWQEDRGQEPASVLLPHRPSDASEVLMLQQQEFLRLTRLNSGPNTLPPSIPFNDLKDRNNQGDKESLSGEEREPGYYSACHSSQARSPYGAPAAYTTSAAVPNASSNLEMHKLHKRRVPLSSNHSQNTNNNNNNNNEEIQSRPSYSSSHLQSYLDSTYAARNTEEARKKRMSTTGTGQQLESFSDGGDPTAVQGYTVTDGVRQQPSQAGLSATQSRIQGEDDQGRWIGTPTTSDPRVAQHDVEVPKSKCCTIL
ncbi:hypothetical protein BC939DRAFT_466534 [Gamsiella multidivaricata]|uniref:uncharacterized protein n=1 Tax=Gamsiella multidivaricata TaxID=101098 RepID=UPI002220BDE7|nr:uncharacterized protein BC939DRAFT_466534 [Gamsiella multidivaricata]KAI7817244.1 hypothetical protein BC939DRAFT_466534 [Gamsiella multidivaricata]